MLISTCGNGKTSKIKQRELNVIGFSYSMNSRFLSVFFPLGWFSSCGCYCVLLTVTYTIPGGPPSRSTEMTSSKDVIRTTLFLKNTWENFDAKHHSFSRIVSLVDTIATHSQVTNMEIKPYRQICSSSLTHSDQGRERMFL
jgi:hypothetical protein